LKARSAVRKKRGELRGSQKECFRGRKLYDGTRGAKGRANEIFIRGEELKRRAKGRTKKSREGARVRKSKAGSMRAATLHLPQTTGGGERSMMKEITWDGRYEEIGRGGARRKLAGSKSANGKGKARKHHGKGKNSSRKSKSES